MCNGSYAADIVKRSDAQACVAEEVGDATLAALLHANDALNAAISLWQQFRERAAGGGEPASRSSPASQAANADAADGHTPPMQVALPHAMYNT